MYFTKVIYTYCWLTCRHTCMQFHTHMYLDPFGLICTFECTFDCFSFYHRVIKSIKNIYNSKIQ